MNCYYGCGADEADNKMNVNIELRDLTFKVFSLIIKFFIIFIIYASIALSEIRCEVIVISINLMKELIIVSIVDISMSFRGFFWSRWKIR